jgi:hypothetical protein
MGRLLKKHYQNLCRFSLLNRTASTLQIDRELWDRYFIEKYNMGYCQHTAEALDGASMLWSESREVSVHLTRSKRRELTGSTRINIINRLRKTRKVFLI